MIHPPPWAVTVARVVSCLISEEAVNLLLWSVAGGLWGWNLYAWMEYWTR